MMALNLVVAFAATLWICLSWGMVSGAEETGGEETAEIISAILEEGDGAFFQEGKATWYGKMFHGRKTTSGETYDMHALTAAHRTLPFGTHVRVTNPANGNKVVVRINDRGPFANDSVIDVSYAAAQKLKIVHSGPIPVRLEALGFKKKEGERIFYEPVDVDAGKFIILLGIFRDYEAAKGIAEELKKMSQFAGIKKLKRKNGTVYRVFAGTYSSLKAAEAARLRFKQEGYEKSLVVSSF